MNFVRFKEYCKIRHDIEVNQKYDGNLPYSKHLDFVASFAYRFKYLLEVYDVENSVLFEVVLSACYGHDLIEDARLTYNDVKDKAGETVADIIYKCTEEKGRNREERHSERYYLELGSSPIALFVKLCDILANVTYSILTNSTMYYKHKKEHEKTKAYLYMPTFKPMFDYLDKLFDLENV